MLTYTEIQVLGLDQLCIIGVCDFGPRPLELKEGADEFGWQDLNIEVILLGLDSDDVGLLREKRLGS